MKTFVSFMLATCFLFTSCATKTQSGAVAGAVIGTGVGAVAGGVKGAIIGGAAGTITGTIVGHYLDEQDRRVLEKSSPKTIKKVDQKEPLAILDIIKLSQAGVSDDKIIQYLKDRKTSYNLTQEQVNELKHGSVSKRVINYLVSTGR